MSERHLRDILEDIGSKLDRKEDYSWFNLHYNRFLETLRTLTDNVAEGCSLLEVGCSPGILTLAIKRLGYAVHGVDLDPRGFFESFSGHCIPIAKCDIEKERMPFEDEPFDVVLFTEVMEHLSFYRVEYALNEIKRVLKRRGLLIVSTPNLAALENRFFLLKGGLSSLGGGIINPAHNREYTLEEVLNMLRNVGFDIKEQWYSMSRDVVTHVGAEYVSREHVLKGFPRHRNWINVGRALAYPLKLLVPSFRSVIFVLATKPQRGNKRALTTKQE